MCLAIPMKIVAFVDEATAEVDLDGLRQQVDLGLLDAVEMGDYVIVHAGYAIERLDLDEANARLELFREFARLSASAPRED
jgi:hydrogenase expression/formation protein HypC